MTETSQNNTAASNSHLEEPGENEAHAESIDLGKRVEALEAELKEKEAKYLYLYAEQENFKKRAIKERSDLIKFGWEHVAREMIEVADNLDRVVAHAPQGCDKNFLDGLKMVQSHFHKTLEKSGVQAIKSLEKPFDPHLHEAMGEEPSSHPEGFVVREQVPGYTLHGRLLRPARVMLSAKKA